jgi:DNA-binding transcriptional MerR regulator
MADKSADAFRTIGEMADTLGVRTHILRYWEEQFPMLQPLKRAGGRRLYRPDDVTLLHTINRLLNSEGYTIKGARKFLSGGGTSAATVAAAPMMTAATPAQFDMSALRAVRDRLSAALAAG